MTTRKKTSRPRKSGNQILHELPITHLSDSKRRECLLELVECFIEAAEEDSSDTHRSCLAVLEKYEIDVSPLDVG